MTKKSLLLWRLGAGVYLVGCMAMIFVGAATENAVLPICGIVILFGGSFLAAIILSLVTVIKAVKTVDSAEQKPADGAATPLERATNWVDADNAKKSQDLKHIKELRQRLAATMADIAKQDATQPETPTQKTNKARADHTLQHACVMTCISHAATSGSDKRTATQNGDNYQLQVVLDDGTPKMAYVSRYYRPGEEVMVRENRGRDLVTVVE